MWVLNGGVLQSSGHPALVLEPALVERVLQVQASMVCAVDGVAQLLISGKNCLAISVRFDTFKAKARDQSWADFKIQELHRLHCLHRGLRCQITSRPVVAEGAIVASIPAVNWR